MRLLLGLIIVVAVGLFLVDWRSTRESIGKVAQERVAVAKRNIDLATGGPPKPPQPKRDETWCRSISNSDGQLQWCLQALREGAFGR